MSLAEVEQLLINRAGLSHDELRERIIALQRRPLAAEELRRRTEEAEARKRRHDEKEAALLAQTNALMASLGDGGVLISSLPEPTIGDPANNGASREFLFSDEVLALLDTPELSIRVYGVYR